MHCRLLARRGGAHIAGAAAAQPSDDVTRLRSACRYCVTARRGGGDRQVISRTRDPEAN
jgi:hypothetical protein